MTERVAALSRALDVKTQSTAGDCHCADETGCKHGPGYASPMEAFKNGPREKLMYVTCIRNDTSGGEKKPDYLATIDIDPLSVTYSQVVHRLYMPYAGDEIHHTGWNSCSSCYHDPSKRRDFMVMPCLESSRIYIVNTHTDPRAPRIHKVVEGDDIKEKCGASMLHTPHCLPSNEVMIASIGDDKAKSKGRFVLLRGTDFSIKSTWEVEPMDFGYDFWYQPRHNVLISSGWGPPWAIRGGFNPKHLEEGLYGRQLTVFNWTNHERLQTIDLGPEGYMPLEIRMLHEPTRAEGYVASTINSNIFRFYKKTDGTWDANKVIDIPDKKVENWLLPVMPSIIVDQLISMDDRYLYFSNWAHGDIRQYDITDTRNPKLVGQLWVSGSICREDAVKVTSDSELTEQPKALYMNGRRVHGGPQMLQLSLDGKRMYVTTSLYTPWDTQFYPEMVKHGSMMLLVDVDTEKGGLTLNRNFCIDFGLEPTGPSRAHEMRYPGGDCTSDIWL